LDSKDLKETKAHKDIMEPRGSKAFRVLLAQTVFKVYVVHKGGKGLKVNVVNVA
jgi:hypothetical protein